MLVCVCVPACVSAGCTSSARDSCWRSVASRWRSPWAGEPGWRLRGWPWSRPSSAWAPSSPPPAWSWRRRPPPFCQTLVYVKLHAIIFPAAYESTLKAILSSVRLIRPYSFTGSLHAVLAHVIRTSSRTQPIPGRGNTRGIRHSERAFFLNNSEALLGSWVLTKQRHARDTQGHTGNNKRTRLTPLLSSAGRRQPET